MNEEFEKWAMQAPLYLPMGKAKDGGYYFSETSVAWLAWQASRKQALEEAANVCDEKWNVAPRGRVMCAAAIRALQQ